MALARASTLAARLEPISPGRVRLHVPSEHRSENQLEALCAVLSSHPDVEAVEIDHDNGTVVIVGGGGGGLGGAVADLLEVVAAESAPGSRAGLDRAVQMLGSVDGRIRARTGGWVSLRWIVPAAVIGLGLRMAIARRVVPGTWLWMPHGQEQG